MLNLIYKILYAKIKRLPYKLTIALNNKCNARCIHCNIWKNRKNEKENLNLADYKKIFEKLPRSIFWISFTGGEPTLNKNLLDIIKLTCNTIPQIKILSIVSNGTNQNKLIEIVKCMNKFPKIQFYLTISLDGKKQVHDSLRGVKGLYDKIISSLILLNKIKKKNIKINIETLVTNKNIENLSEFLRSLNNMQKRRLFDTHTLTLFHTSFFYDNLDSKLSLNKKQFLLYRKLIERYFKHIKLPSYLKIIQKKYLLKSLDFIKNKSMDIKCRSLKDSIFISNLGEIYPCLNWKKSLGFLEDYNYEILKAYKSKKANKLRNDILQKKCSKCWMPCEAYQSIIGSYIHLI